MKNKEICILLIDEEPDFLDLISMYLSSEGYKIIIAENGEKGVALAIDKTPHLIFLDFEISGLGGIEVCKQLRGIPKLGNSIITFLTSRIDLNSQLKGFDVGADDFISKKIKPKLFIKKVKALLRKFKGGVQITNMVIGNIVINREEYFIFKENIEINLPRKQFELLSLLASRPGKVFSRKEIRERIWGKVVIKGRTIDAHIRKIREKLGEEDIQTVKGVGYRMNF